MTSGTLLTHAHLDAVGNDHLAALMLAQILYWYAPGKFGKTKLKVQKGNRLWLVKTHKDWFEELRLGRRQVDRCIKVLEDRGLILTEVFVFQGRPCRHLLLKSEAALHFGVQSNCTISCNPIAPISANGLHLKVQTITETTTETTQETTTPADAGKEPAMPTVKEVMEAMGASKPAAGKIGAKSLALLWKKEVGLAVSGMGFVKELSAKEMGQLSLLNKKLGTDAPKALAWALRNWGKFTAEVAIQKGLPGIPLMPLVGFLLEHHDVAITEVTKAEQKAKAPKLPTPFVAPPHVVNPQPCDNGEGVASESEVMNALEQLAALNKKQV